MLPKERSVGMESNLVYWLWLSTRKGIRAQVVSTLLFEFDESPEKIYYAPKRQLEELGVSPRLVEHMEDKSLDRANGILGDCQRLGITILTWQDATYPSGLRDLIDPPLVLYMKGTLPPLEGVLAIAMVGARKASPYGVVMASRIAMGLAHSRAVVVTGMAQGIDTACVQGALKMNGAVISVVAGGLDVIYPKQSQPLYEDVAKVGALLSEYPPATKHLPEHFRERNRILSGISRGVVVVEAERTSGSIITGELAVLQQRDLFVVPGDVLQANMQGILFLMQQYQGYPVGEAQHIFQFYGDEFRVTRQVPSEESRVEDVYQRVVPVLVRHRNPPISQQQLEQEEKEREEAGKNKEDAKRVLYIPTVEKNQWEELQPQEQLVLRQLTKGQQSQDELVEATALVTADLVSALISLEMEGMIEEVADRHFRILVRLSSECKEME